jgi:hypothetical protein
MSQTAIKPELFPTMINGDIHWLKRGDYAKRTADNLAITTKAELKKEHALQALDAIEKGQRELAGDNPEPFVKLFATILEDYDAAVEKVKQDQQAEADKKAAEELAKKEKTEKEEGLFLSIKDTNTGLDELTQLFDTGDMDRFVPKGDVTNEQMLSALNTAVQMGEFTAWMRGDLVVELEKRDLLQVVARVAESKGIPYSGLYNDAKTAKAFPPEKRTKGVSFTIFRELANAKFTPEQVKAKESLVNEIAEGKHTTQSIREAVKKAQGKTPPAELGREEDPKRKFLVIDTGLADEGKLVEIALGFPKKLVGGGVTIIDAKTMEQFTGKKKEEERWVALAEYKDPEAPAPAAAPAAPAPTPAPAAAAAAKKGKGKK